LKYTSEIEIDIPLNVFIKKLDNPDNMKHWQKGLQSYEHISGKPGKVGAKMKLNFMFKKRHMELIETIIENNFPDSFKASYDTKGMHNIQKNYFKKTSPNSTKWICENEYLPTSFFMKLMISLMPSAFKKQSLGYMEDFKNFVENEVSVTEL